MCDLSCGHKHGKSAVELKLSAELQCQMCDLYYGHPQAKAEVEIKLGAEFQGQMCDRYYGQNMRDRSGNQVGRRVAAPDV